MEAEILQRPPLSGSYEEHNFTVSGDTVWIKFFDEKWLEWCGVFSLGESSFTAVQQIPDEPVFLVIAGGQGYYIDVNTRKVLHTTTWEDINAIIYVDAIKSFAVSDDLRVGILKDYTITWASERISLDGIQFLECTGPIVKGMLNAISDWVEFEFDVISGRISSSWLFHENIY